MTILTVIPCLNEEKHIEKIVRQLATVNAKLPMRIIIADGGSRDRTREIAQELTRDYPNVILLDNPKRIQGAAINLAVELYSGGAEYLVRIDAHSDYPDDYCRALIEEARNTGAESVVVSMQAKGFTQFQRAVAEAQNSKLGNGGSAHRIVGKIGMWVEHGHHALMRIRALQAVGGYDESFSHNEDAELDMRLRKAGFKIWLTGKTSLTYHPRAAALPLFLQYMRHGYGRARNILKHHAWPRLRQLVPAAVLPSMVLAVFGPIAWPMTIPLMLWAIFCLGYGIMLGIKANDIHIAAAAGPAAMIMHAGWSLGFWNALIVNIGHRQNQIPALATAGRAQVVSRE